MSKTICILWAMFALPLFLAASDRATWYGDAYRGKLMANGHPFDPDAMTAASWDFPLGCKLLITHAGKSIVVEVTDRGGKKSPGFERTVDLSRGAFARLAKPKLGVIGIEIERIEREGGISNAATCFAPGFGLHAP